MIIDTGILESFTISSVVTGKSVIAPSVIINKTWKMGVDSVCETKEPNSLSKGAKFVGPEN